MQNFAPLENIELDLEDDFELALQIPADDYEQVTLFLRSFQEELYAAITVDGAKIDPEKWSPEFDNAIGYAYDLGRELAARPRIVSEENLRKINVESAKRRFLKRNRRAHRGTGRKAGRCNRAWAAKVVVVLPIKAPPLQEAVSSNFQSI